MSNVPSYPSDAADRESEVPTRADSHQYAGWWSRVGATLIDGLLLAVPIVVLFILAGVTAGEDEDSSAALIVIAYLLSILIPFVYYTVMHGGERGQTIGKRATGIRVVDEKSGGRLSHGKAFGRYAITFVFSLFVIPILLDYLWPLWDDRNQSLHDKVAGSLVVRA